MPRSQPAIAGDLGISAEWPTAASTTISAVTATKTNPHTTASAGAHCATRVRARPSSPPAATLTTPRGSQRCPDGLGLQVGVEALVAMLASDPGRLQPAKWRRRVGDAPDVDVHRAGAQHCREAMGGAHIARPHARGEAVVAVVGPRSDLLELLIGRGDQHGAEDLLTDDARLVVVDAEQRR